MSTNPQPPTPNPQPPALPLLPVLLAGWLACAGCAVLPVALQRPLPSTSMALDGMEEAQRSLAEAWTDSEKNVEAAANSKPVAAHGAPQAAYQRWVADEVRELPESSQIISIGGGDT